MGKNGYNCIRKMFRGMDMIGVLLAINIGISFIILLAISMIRNHFKKIDRSMRIYADKKTYKSKSDTLFLDSLIEKYRVIVGYNKNNNIDVQMMIHKSFCEENIGRFKYTGVQSIANKGKIVMWGVLISQIGLELLKGVASYSKISFAMIIANSLICMLITLIGVIKGIPEEREKLIIELTDYIVNTYPAELEWQREQKNIKELKSEVEQLKEVLDSYKTIETQNNINEVHKQTQNEEYKEVQIKETIEEILQEKDIIHLLDKIKLNV